LPDSIASASAADGIERAVDDYEVLEGGRPSWRLQGYRTTRSREWVVTVRAVEVHLSRTYATLGVRSRGRLAARLVAPSPPKIEVFRY
jgi:hypothetical protein